jgi:hypothetical protein
MAMFAVLLVGLVGARGLFTNRLLAGHDAPAYPVTQHQFHQNIREGVIFPRWAPDMRYGYGHPQLQFRPPALHYLAEPLYALTGNPFLSINLTLAALVFVAGFGMYVFARSLMRPAFAAVAAAAYVTANYYLANLYLRGAYYETTAYAFMPWILWGQGKVSGVRCQVSGGRVGAGAVAIGALAWAGLVCGHPATALFFLPVAVGHALLSWHQTRRGAGIAYSALMFLAGVLVSAPYTYVFLRETPLVRMQIFYSGMDSFHLNFYSIRQWITDRWPDAYTGISRWDEFGRPKWLEMRGADAWGLAALCLAPVFWFLRPREGEQHLRPCAMFFHLAAVGTLALCLPISHGLWERCEFLHAFNFPWRVLSVTSLSLALVFGLTIEWATVRLRLRPLIACFAAAGLMAAMSLTAWPHTAGWPGVEWMTRDQVESATIRRHRGIPSEFYTPRWVSRHAEAPAPQEAMVVEGRAQAVVVERQATRWRLDVQASEPARIAVAHYYYPGWRVYGLAAKPAEPEIWSDRGLIAFAVPAGRHDVELRFGLTPVRVQAYGLSLLGIGLAVCGSLWRRLCRSDSERFNRRPEETADERR